MGLEKAILMEPVKEKLNKIEDCLIMKPETAEETEVIKRFCKFMAGRLQGELTPKEFHQVAYDVLFDFAKEIQNIPELVDTIIESRRGGKFYELFKKLENLHSDKKMSGYINFFYWLDSELPIIACSVCPFEYVKTAFPYSTMESVTEFGEKIAKAAELAVSIQRLEEEVNRCNEAEA